VYRLELDRSVRRVQGRGHIVAASRPQLVIIITPSVSCDAQPKHLATPLVHRNAFILLLTDSEHFVRRGARARFSRHSARMKRGVKGVSAAPDGFVEYAAVFAASRRVIAASRSLSVISRRPIHSSSFVATLCMQLRSAACELRL